MIGFLVDQPSFTYSPDFRVCQESAGNRPPFASRPPVSKGRLGTLCCAPSPLESWLGTGTACFASRSLLEELTALLQDASRGLVGKPKAVQIWETVERNKVPSSEHEAIRNISIRSNVAQLKVTVEEMKTLEDEIERFLYFFDYPLTSMEGKNILGEK